MQGSPARIAVDRRVIICVRIVSIRTDSGDRRHHKRLNFPKKLEKGTARDRDGGQRGRFVAHQYGSPLVRECSFRTAVGAESARGASRLLDRVGGLRAMALKLIKATVCTYCVACNKSVSAAGSKVMVPPIIRNRGIGVDL